MFDFQCECADWEADFIGINKVYLTQLRLALRQEFAPAVRAYGLRNKRLAQQLESLGQDQVDRLAGSLTANFLRFDEQGALDLLVENSIDDGPFEHEVKLKVRETGSAHDSWSSSSDPERFPTPWHHELMTLRLCYLMTMRAGLKDDFLRAVTVFGLASRRFAIALRTMSAGEVLQLAGALRTDFLSFRDSLAIEVLIDRISDSCGEEEVRMAVMAHAAASVRRGSSFFEAM